MSLERLLGSWQITMQHSQVPQPVHGRVTYERVLDGAFVLMRWTYDHPDFPDAMAVINDHSYNYFDVRGVIRLCEFSIDDDGWSMRWLDDGFSQRMTARFAGTNAMDCRGEASDDRGLTWRDDFRLTLTR